MYMNWFTKFGVLGVLALSFTGVALVGCEDDNIIEEAAEDTKDLAEDAADGVKEAGRDTKRAAEDLVD